MYSSCIYRQVDWTRVCVCVCVCLCVCVQRGITLFTVSHRKSLWTHHEVRQKQYKANGQLHQPFISPSLSSTCYSLMVEVRMSSRPLMPTRKSLDPEIQFQVEWNTDNIIIIIELWWWLFIFTFFVTINVIIIIMSITYMLNYNALCSLFSKYFTAWRMAEKSPFSVKNCRTAPALSTRYLQKFQWGCVRVDLKRNE